MTIAMKPMQHKMERFVSIFLILSLLASAMPFASLASQEPLPIQSILLDLAQTHPEQPVSVIVQQLAPDGRAQALVESLGGLVTHDLSLINAFAADLPAAALPALAASRLARWISLNAGMVESQDGGNLVYSTWASEIGQGPNVKSKDFKDDAIAAGNTIWFSAVVKAKDLNGNSATVTMLNTQVRFTVGGKSMSWTFPMAVLSFSRASPPPPRRLMPMPG